MRTLWLFVAIEAFAALTPGASGLLLTHANIRDGVNDAPMRDRSILIENGHIAAISSDSVLTRPGVEELDLHGQWVLPGLIDAHGHIDNLPAARAALASGVTTVRDLGTAHYADVGLRELHRHGVSDIPEIIAAGYVVQPHPGENLFLDHPELSRFISSGFQSKASLHALVGSLLSRHIDVVKMFATERAGIASGDPQKRTFSDTELQEIVSIAARAHKPAVAHAHGDLGIRAAVEAGANTIEHGTYASEETLRLMKRSEVCFDPTISYWNFLSQHQDPALRARAVVMKAAVLRAVRQARALGVRIIAGTDTDYKPNGRRIVDEMRELMVAGMTASEVIRAATSVSAGCLGLHERIGSVRTGMEADLIVLSGDPSENLELVANPAMVISDGVIVSRPVDSRNLHSPVQPASSR